MVRADLAIKSLVPATVLVGAVILAIHGFGNDGLRQALRGTARIALILFLLAYVASPLNLLLPSRATQWLVAHRTTIGVYFGLSISTHIMLIIALFIEGGWMPKGVNPADLYIGIPGLIFAIFMTVTSSHYFKRLIPSVAWHWAHRIGLHLIWLIYVACLVDSFGRKSPPSSPWLYLPPICLLLFAAVLRFLAWTQNTKIKLKAQVSEGHND
jgi:hypothetical protein